MFVMRGKMHSTEAVAAALERCRAGLSDYEVARLVGIPRSTIQRWRQVGPPSRRQRTPDRVISRPLDNSAYSYLLGMYLGDAWISAYGSSVALSFKLDRRYPGVIEECARATAASVPTTVKWCPPKHGAIRIYARSDNWLHLFPQHGAGQKHERKIELTLWQREITCAHTRDFLRGLIHSDGCRTINRFAVNLPSGRVGRYAYPRYFFTNYSADIRHIFCEHCDLVGIRWSQSNRRNISVANRESVAILDSFVGPKS
jgi:Homeodomain-like domain